MGAKKNAGNRGAAAANKFIGLGIDELRPFAQAGAGAIPGLEAGATVGGLDERLRQILNTDIFSSLVGERQRGVQGQLAAGGLNRSGTAVQEMANLGPDLALQLEQMLTGRASNLAGQGLGAAGGIANLFGQQGENVSSGIVSKAQAQASGLGQIAKLASGIFFSDPRLKENAELVSQIGDLGVYEWDWIPEAKGTIIMDCQTVGFMADEVEGKYPHHVGEFCGWKAINYPALLDELEGKFVH